MDHPENGSRAGFVDRAGAALRRIAAHALRAMRVVLLRGRGLASRWLTDPALRRRARVVARDLALAGLLALFVLGGGALLFERIEPGTIGVRQVDWGSERAIDARDLPPGLYFGPRPLYSWHHLDARTRVVDFGAQDAGAAHPPLELRSASGTTLSVSVSVPYRVASGEANALVRDGLKLAWPMRVKSTVEHVLEVELSKLDAEGFADPARRQEAESRALARLNADLSVLHAVAEGVFVRAFEYAPTYERKKLEEQLAGQTLETNDVLVELKRKKLENEFLAQSLKQEREALTADWKRRIEAEEDEWKNQRLEQQKIRNQFLALGIDARKQEALTRLGAAYQQAKRAERDAALEAQALATQAIQQRVAREEAEHADDLQRALEGATRAAEAGLAALRARNELAAAGSAREEGALDAELARAAQADRLAAERDRLEVEREAAEAARAVRAEADRAYLALAAEGDAARAKAASLREELTAQALAHPGARAVLARDAAESLRFDRVALDANDPRVPTVLDLDALVELLVGNAK